MDNNIYVVIANIIVSFVLMYAIRKSNEASERISQYELEMKQQELLNKHYDEIEKIYNGLREMKHDMCHHMSYMNYLIENNEFDKATKYFSEFKAKMNEKNFMFLSGNETIDIVINQKMLVAKEYGIHMICDFQKVSIDSIKDYDLCSVLSNLLDNAIEAVKICEDKLIHMSLKKEKNCLIIREENAYAEINILDDGTIITTKKDKKLHGLGVKNIKHIVEEYDGYMNYELKDGRFMIKIVIKDEM